MLKTSKTKMYTQTDQDIIHSSAPSRYVLRVKDLEEGQKPREKLLNLGVDSLNLEELIAIILGTGTRKEEVLSMARRIAKDYGEKALSVEKNPTKITTALDVPEGKATQIIAAVELGRRLYLKKKGLPVYLRTDLQAYQHLSSMGNLEKEHLRGLYLNSRYQIIHDEVISVGSLTASIIHPREVFLPALEKGAVAIIIAHNHPSGDPSPTKADIEITAQLKSAGKLLGIELIDHLIIAQNKYQSIVNKTLKD